MKGHSGALSPCSTPTTRGRKEIIGGSLSRRTLAHGRYVSRRSSCWRQTKTPNKRAEKGHRRFAWVDLRYPVSLRFGAGDRDVRPWGYPTCFCSAGALGPHRPALALAIRSCHVDGSGRCKTSAASALAARVPLLPTRGHGEHRTGMVGG